MKTFWESKYDKLALFNAEKQRGIVHTEEYEREMKELQAEYDKKLLSFNVSNSVLIIS